jgi:signal transduction histidine kinase
VAAAGTAVGELTSPIEHLDSISMFLLAGWAVAVIAMGVGVRTRKAYLREAERRAAEEARQQGTDERLRMARELHDVLGHNISLINVQASAALHRLTKDPGDDPVDALTAIKETSRQALRELRATLGVLRQVDEDAPLEPAASLSGLDALLDRARSTGLAVRGEVAGAPRPVPPEVDLAAYRIVQEALTNVARHAAAATAVVRIGYQDEDVCVQVDDDGTGGPGGPAKGGSGIRGMRERARALGGELSAGARPEGGFRVLARLPLGERP